MPVIKRDYTAFPYLDKGKYVKIHRPYVPIRLSNKRRILPYLIDCLVDSGADHNLLPAYLGEQLGIHVSQGEKLEHVGIGDMGITAYIHRVRMYVDTYGFETEVHFSYQQKIPLLGRYSFFRFFQSVTFNEQALQLELSY
jgi:hypothetical protein